MSPTEAVRLWNELCRSNHGGEWGGFDRLEPLGFTAAGAELPTILEAPRRHEQPAEKEKREAVSLWLQRWGRALEQG